MSYDVRLGSTRTQTLMIPFPSLNGVRADNSLFSVLLCVLNCALRIQYSSAWASSCDDNGPSLYLSSIDFFTIVDESQYIGCYSQGSPPCRKVFTFDDWFLDCYCMSKGNLSSLFANFRHV